MLFQFRKKYNEVNFLKSKKSKELNPLLSLHKLKLRSYYLDRKVKVDIYLPNVTDLHPSTLLVNDGQDMEQLRLVKTLTDLFSVQDFPKFAVVAIHANENRMQEYGVAGRPDYKNRGKKAENYSDFITRELVPFLQREYGLMDREHQHVFAGFSMGALSALDICWNYPQLFDKVGVFSGSLWWRKLNTGSVVKDDNSRIMHQRIRNGVKRDDLKFWFQTGTKDENIDRNNNGVIDSIDDTLDLIKELKAIGYKDNEIVYEEVVNGHHNFNTWSQVFPKFLKWAYQRNGWKSS